MLKNSKAFSSFSVDDLTKAKVFYTKTLGLKISEIHGYLELHTTGNNPIMIYPKDNHVPATHTVLNFPVANIEQVVDDLSEKGIVFEQYKGELETDKKGISVNPDWPKMAWFKDPAGNFIALMEKK